MHVLCNNAGIGAGAEGPIWEHELRDWEWAIGVNVWGVIHGINAFVPTMLANGEPGHVVNTSSGNGGISPLPSTPQYAATKAAVVTITECLYGQLADTPLSRVVLFPGPHMLRTGLFESWRSRPDRFAKTRPRQTPYTTVEALEEQMKAAGVADRLHRAGRRRGGDARGDPQRHVLDPSAQPAHRRGAAAANAVDPRPQPTRLPARRPRLTRDQDHS